MKRRDFFRLTTAITLGLIVPQLVVSRSPTRAWTFDTTSGMFTVLVTNPGLKLEDVRYLAWATGRVNAHSVCGFKPGEIVLLHAYGACSESSDLMIRFRRARPSDVAARSRREMPVNLAGVLS